MDWGTVPEWFGATTTAGTLVITLLLLRRQLSVWDGDSQFKQKAQASLVAVWTLPPPAGSENITRVKFHNASDQPVYGFRVWFTEDNGRRQTVRVSSPLGPGYAEEFDIPAAGSKDPPWAPVECDFVDALGVHWHRSGAGRLTNLGENDNPWPSGFPLPEGENPPHPLDGR